MVNDSEPARFRWIWGAIGLAVVFLASFMIGRFPVAPHQVAAILASQVLPIDPFWPAEAATIGTPGSSRWAAATAASPPRTLNEPVGWRVSSLKTMSAPRPEAGVIGVGERKRRTTSPAAESVSASGKVTVRMHTVSPRRARPVRRPSSGWHLRNGYACNS